MPARLELTGKVFGDWTVVAPAGMSGANTLWSVRCKCGVTKVVRGKSLTTGKAKSCRTCRCRSFGYGLRDTSEYKAWGAMKYRCFNKRCKFYADYGGRGINVCYGLCMFERFFNLLGIKPPNMTLDRINNDMHYSCGECDECLTRHWPLNVRWATREQQCRNRRTTVMATFRGKTRSVTEWAEHFGINRETVYHRIKRMHMAPEQALTTPRLRKRKRQSS